MMQAKRKTKKVLSLLLVLSMMLSMTLTQLPTMAFAETGTSTIQITQQPTPSLEGYFGGSPGTIAVTAIATNGAEILYQWKVEHNGVTSIDPDISWRQSSLILSEYLLPGTYTYSCELKAEGCAPVVSNSTILTVSKATYTDKQSDTFYVKANTSTNDNVYTLPDLPVSDMTYTIQDSGGSLVTGVSEPKRKEIAPWEWILTFDTASKPDNTQEDIILKINGGFLYEDSTFILTVKAVDKLAVTISDLTGTDNEYSGVPQQGYSGTPQTGEYIGELNHHYKGRNITTYDSGTAPTDAGDYTVTLSVPEEADYRGTLDIDFSIKKKEVLVKPVEYNLVRGQALSILSNIWVNYTGFVASDNVNNSISTWAVAKFNVSDTNTVGSSPITFATEATLLPGKEKNYTLKHENGTLNIQQGSTITVQDDGHGTASASLDSAGWGVVITLTAVPDKGYRLKEWQVISGDVTINGNQFTMSYLDVTVKAIFEIIPVAEYNVTVINGTANPTTAVAGTTVTITANTAPSGKQFKAWTVQSDGVTLANSNAATTTFTMPASTVEVTATYEDISVVITPVTEITLNRTTLSLYSNTTPRTADLTATVEPYDATDKTVTWQSSNTAVATVDTSGKVTAVGNGTAVITATTTDGGRTASCTVTVTTYSSSSGSGGGSSSGESSTTTTTTTSEKKPNQPVTVSTPVTATAGKKGTASATISDKTIIDAIAKAQADAKSQGKTTNGISVALIVTMPQGGTSLTVTLTQNSLSSLVNSGVTSLEVNGAPVSIGFDLAALKEIQKQSSGNISISITPATGLTTQAKALIGNRPVHNITISTVKDGKTTKVTSLGTGTATLSIPYTPGKNEAVGYLFGVYVDGNGKAARINCSAYDANAGAILLSTGHFSVYGVGYTAPSSKLTDIDTHWGKEAIDYVVGRGLVFGTSETTFAPNTAMTRGMLVTALGRLAEVDIKLYTTNSFTDVKADSVFRPYIEWACKKGIVQDIGNQQFAPDRAITREEIAVIFANYAKSTDYKLPVTREAITYADASSIGSAYKTAVTAMQQSGIMVGGADNNFSPKANATRAEVSSMLYRYIKLTIDPITTQGWVLNDAGQYLYYKDGNMISGKWLQIDGKWYYFYADGSLAKAAKVDGYDIKEEKRK